jgi:hypothetical protein
MHRSVLDGQPSQEAKRLYCPMRWRHKQRKLGTALKKCTCASY